MTVVKNLVTEQTEKKVSYSVGMKVNIGNYQTVDLHVSESDTFSTAGLSPQEVDDLAVARYNYLREKLDQALTVAVSELKAANA